MDYNEKKKIKVNSDKHGGKKVNIVSFGSFM